MPLEQASGKHPSMSAQTSMRSVRGILYHVSVGTTPYVKEGMLPSWCARWSSPSRPSPPGGGSPRSPERQIVEKAMARSPLDRYLTARSWRRCDRTNTSLSALTHRLAFAIEFSRDLQPPVASGEVRGRCALAGWIRCLAMGPGRLPPVAPEFGRRSEKT
jgi:hypothetical protein